MYTIRNVEKEPLICSGMSDSFIDFFRNVRFYSVFFVMKNY